jgi:hypothetical protein
MKLERLTLFRDNSPASIKASNLLKSAKASNLLKKNNIHYVEVYNNHSGHTPSLMRPGATYKGYNNILHYVNSLKNL